MNRWIFGGVGHVLVVLLLCAPAGAEEAEQTYPEYEPSPLVGETTDPPPVRGIPGTLFGKIIPVEQTYPPSGVSIFAGLTQIYQANLHGGLSTHQHSGRHAGSYCVDVGLDLEKLVRLSGASLHMLAEGGWSQGLSPGSVGSLFSVNSDAPGKRAIDITQLYYEQVLFGEKLRIRLGKLWMFGGFRCRGCAVAFDGNDYANDRASQFLNAAFANNPTIPFPQAGLSVIAYVQPSESWYVAGGVADAEADFRETGFSTTFDGDSDFFYIFETGLVPQVPSKRGVLPGAYRIGTWHNHQTRARFTGGTRDSDTGFYVSANQMVWRESDVPKDDQGLGVFGRFGVADDDVRDVELFWSVGAQYKGLIPRREKDVLAIGFAQGRLSDHAGFTTSHESVTEIYYNAQVTSHFNVTPAVQYVVNPGGDAALKDAVVAGVRVQLNF